MSGTALFHELISSLAVDTAVIREGKDGYLLSHPDDFKKGVSKRHASPSPEVHPNKVVLVAAPRLTPVVNIPRLANGMPAPPFNKPAHHPVTAPPTPIATTPTPQEVARLQREINAERAAHSRKDSGEEETAFANVIRQLRHLSKVNNFDPGAVLADTNMSNKARLVHYGLSLGPESGFYDTSLSESLMPRLVPSLTCYKADLKSWLDDESAYLSHPTYQSVCSILASATAPPRAWLQHALALVFLIGFGRAFRALPPGPLAEETLDINYETRFHEFQFGGRTCFVGINSASVVELGITEDMYGAPIKAKPRPSRAKRITDIVSGFERFKLLSIFLDTLTVNQGSAEDLLYAINFFVRGALRFRQDTMFREHWDHSNTHTSSSGSNAWDDFGSANKSLPASWRSVREDPLKNSQEEAFYVVCTITFGLLWTAAEKLE